MLFFAIPSVQARSPLTPEAALETARFMMDASGISVNNPQGAVSLSPSGRWWVARLIRGDIVRNGLWMEIFAGEARSLDQASEMRTVARLFSTGLGSGGGVAGPNQDGLSEATPLQWLDEETIAFLWSDETGRRQVMRVNVKDRSVEKLTAHEQGVVTFDIANDGTLVFSAPTAMPKSDLQAQLREGFVVAPDTDAASLIQGYVNQGSIVDRLWRTQWFVQRVGQPPTPIRVANRDFDPNPYERIWMAPQGRWGLIAAVPTEVPMEWSRYRDPSMSSRVRHARQNPESMLGRLVYQLYVLDTLDGSTRPLWSAPTNADVVRCAWSPDQREIAIAPAFLPVREGIAEAGLEGRVVAVIERETGNYELLPIDLKDQSIGAIRWKDPNFLSLHVRDKTVSRVTSFKRVEGQWRRVEASTPAATGVRFELRQSLDTPPILSVVDPASGRSKLLIDPNPGLEDRYRLGRAELLSAEMGNSRRWRGLLLYPPSFDPSRRYPLVIQSVYGSLGASDFSLYGLAHGYGLGPTPIAAYPGRALAQHDILVLHMTVEGDEGRATPHEAPLRMEAFEHAISTLAQKGYVDEGRVGLLGFSRNGYFVEFALSHSPFTYRAAIAADHFDASYVAQTLLGYDMGGSDVNGGKPFGSALQAWVERAPGFNAENIHAPLLQIEQSRGMLGAVLRWETFSRLRYLKKPVELWVIPNAEFGVHNTQNPEQILAQQHVVIDWFRFWLKSEEDADPTKEPQYLRWRILRNLRGTSLDE